MRILGYGDNNVDVNATTGEYLPGGNCVNVAVFAARSGADAAYAGVFGSDDAGARLRAIVEDEGVTTEHCVVRDGETGYSVFVVEDGDRRFIRSNRGGIARTRPLRASEALLAEAARHDVVHSSVYSSSEDDLAAVRAASRIVSYDFSSEAEYRAPGYLRKVAPNVDVALFSCADIDDEECARLLEDVGALGPDFAVATLGPRGALVRHHGALRSIDAGQVRSSDIMDSMGCGDAFVSAFLAEIVAQGWRRGTTLFAEALRAAMGAGIERATSQLLIAGAFGRSFALEPAPGPAS
jgi:sugar/nucleoside kinase (ribokinase family)